MDKAMCINLSKAIEDYRRHRKNDESTPEQDLFDADRLVDTFASAIEDEAELGGWYCELETAIGEHEETENE